LYRNLIASSAASPYRELLLTPGGRELAGGGTGIPIAAELLRALAAAAQNTVLPVAELSRGDTSADFARALLVNTPVAGLPLQLVTLLPAEQAHGHLTSLGVLAAVALVPVLLLLGAIWFNRLSLAADKLQEEILVAEQQRLWAEQRTVEMGTEIRRRETVEEQLRRSEERWELAARGANDGIWDWNPQTGEVHYSDRWKAMLGYAPGDIGTEVQEWVRRIHPDDLHRTMAEVERHQRGETEFYQCEHRLRCKDGSYKWILDRGKALFDAEGNPVRMSGSHTDVTERHAAEARLLDRTEQLNAIFALSPDGFVSFDAERRVKYANPAFFNMIALEEAEILGLEEAAFAKQFARVCTPGAGLPGMDGLRAADELAPRGSRQAGSGDAAGGGRRHIIELAGPGRRMLEVSLRIAQSETVSQILYFRDITHESEVDRLKSEFLSTAAHELRTPMTNIYGFAELLLTREFSDADRLEMVGTIVKHSELMVSIINELLDLVRIEERRGKDFDIERIELRALLRGIVAGFKTPDNRHPPEGPAENGPLWVRADRSKLTQAVSNVLSNAYKYSPGGGAIEIGLAETPPEEGAPARICIRISDRGIGMTPEQLARVSERFYRADASGKIPGTGLGMSIVREIVQLHGGELELASAIGEGTTVSLWLPADAGPAPA
jgi:PAS domain S-box-containing protein